MTITTATVTDQTIIAAERNDSGLVCRVIAEEARPANLADADTFLAVHSFRRTAPWDLVGSAVGAPVAKIDNTFNGTVAARLWDAVGATHDQFETAFASEARDGDLISDMEVCEPYVVAGTRLESGVMRIHMVGEGQCWEERFTTDFPPQRLVKVARKR
jgi:hypothetical protein